MTNIFSLTPGHLPILITIPHAGDRLAPGMEDRMTPRGKRLPDTDWYMEHLYAFALSRGIGVLRANFSRYVVDLNRGHDDAALYPGRPSTGLVPLLGFDGQPIYSEGREPGPAEVAERTKRYWQPYHDAIRNELDRLREACGWAILWDVHSIGSEIPRLFEGRLPDLNFGTNSGQSCAPSLARDVLACAEGLASYSHVRDGRFKGGHTTRHYGRPETGIHAVQLEIAQSTYLASENDPWPIDLQAAATLSGAIERLIDTAVAWRPAPQA
ncbi:N-formylglutamate amidohydrolase [Gluconacetobacter johannae DSM 13595]|uniref:N-formylglutamate deformylase n=1 Tax=Gluconacetobacter johannae TaxID=112140 RepID=A0A7W4J9Y4_9PROT|nr:N-formylglutamate deformylase [Gluconacetobacter johannae]MBB2177382.1 N-formylglutamate deformylase [Gluconacetobacter johannae]GBQ81220.1 N-formylglutamate amidohydrolase [Gluconacetobacter johannae DSM 13595]